MLKPDRPNANPDLPRSSAMSRHVFASAGTLLGVCVTLIGLIKVIEPSTGPSRVDQYVAIPGMFFLVSAILSYIAIRFESRARLSRGCEKIADVSFLTGLILLALIALFFGYELIK